MTTCWSLRREIENSVSTTSHVCVKRRSPPWPHQRMCVSVVREERSKYIDDKAVNINSRRVHIRLKGAPLSNIRLSESLSPYIILLCLDFSTVVAVQWFWRHIQMLWQLTDVYVERDREFRVNHHEHQSNASAMYVSLSWERNATNTSMTMPSMHQFTFTFFALIPHCIKSDWPFFNNKIQSSESERIEVKLLPFTLRANIHVQICSVHEVQEKHLRKHTRGVVALSVAGN